MPNLIEWLGNIGAETKTFDLSDPDIIKDYAPFAVNRGLSQNMDTILLANEMNKRPGLDKEMQYKFLFHAVSKKRRYGKWAKADVIADQVNIEMVARFYSVNLDRAAGYLKLITPAQLDEIKKHMDQGGCDIPKGKAKK